MAVNLLCSYAFHASTDLARVRANLVCGRLMIDSGAFTAWSKGHRIDLDEYAEFLESWRGCWDHAITLDVIGNPAATRKNTQRLWDRGLPVMPVFTRGDQLSDFDAMVREHGYVCVGGLVGIPVKAQRARAAMLQRRAAEQGGGIHALGIGSMTSLRTVRPYSSDASNVSGAFKFGVITYFTGREIRSCAVSDRAKLTRDWSHIRAHGIDLAQLAAARRMPNRQDGRLPLMRSMSLAYAAADEVLKHQYPVDAPQLNGHTAGPHLFNSVIGQGGDKTADVYATAELDTALHPGPHLYNSVGAGWLADSGSAADRSLHGDWCPPVWSTHGRHHAGTALLAVSVDYGQRHRRELDAAAAVATHYGVEHLVLDLTGWGSLLAGSALTDASVDVPHGHYAAPSMATTVVPNRNATLLMATVGVAQARGASHVVTAVHAGDHPIYADCRPEFIHAAQLTAELGTDHAVTIEAPFVSWDKADIAAFAAATHAPLHLTWSCYEGGDLHCGACGTCVERREAFQLAGVTDPTEYATAA